MSQSALASFDPLATHPFTNNSGLMPKPVAPSKYPHPVPSILPTHAAHAVPMHAPQPKRSPQTAQSGRGARGPIFVPFRPERSSPDLDDILLKKKVADVLTNKQSWSIDQSRAPLKAPIAGK